MGLASIEKVNHNLKMNKACQSSDIPNKIIKENVDIFTEFLWKNMNSSIKSSTFPSCLKSADVTPLHEKGKEDKKDKCTPVNILPTLSFDCLNHELLIAKLNMYGFTLPALKLVHDYLEDRKQRTRVNNLYSTSFEIHFGVPQGSILAHCYLTYF